MGKAGCCSTVARQESINRFLNAWCWLALKEVLFSGKGFLSGGGQTKRRRMRRIFVEIGHERKSAFLHSRDGCHTELFNLGDTEQVRKRLWPLSPLKMGDKSSVQM